MTLVLILAFLSLQSRPCSQQLSAVLKALENKSYAAIAQEMEAYRPEGRLLGLLEIEDIKTFLSNRKILAIAKTEFPQKNLEDLYRMDWSDFSIQAREKFIRALGRTANFKVSRKIAGLRIKRTISVTPTDRFDFRGTTYEPGTTYEISLKGFLEPTIEYAASGAVGTASAVEFHFRGTDTKKLLKDADVFFGKILPLIPGESRIDPPTLHQHIIGSRAVIGGLTNKLSPEEIALGFAIYHQMLESLVILKNAQAGTPPYIKPGASEDKPILDYLSQPKTVNVYKFFKGLATGHDQNIGADLKKFNIGVRGRDTYSRDGLWGFEFRYSNTNTARENPDLLEIAQSVRDNMESGQFPIDFEKIKASTSGSSPENLVRRIWWRKNKEEIIASYIDSPLEVEVAAFLKPRQISMDGTKRDWGSLLPFALHRWDLHPLAKDNNSFKERIFFAQKKLLERLRSGLPIKESLLEFFNQSRIEDFLYDTTFPKT